MRRIVRPESDKPVCGHAPQIGSSQGTPENGQRSGLTLLEVLLATAIFLGSITAIMQVLRIGHDSRISAKLDAEAAVRCESKLGEYVSGITPLVAESDAPFLDSSEWFYTSTLEEGGGESLLKLTVLVEHKPNGQQPTSYFQLTRLIRDPELFLEAALSAASAEDSE